MNTRMVKPGDRQMDIVNYCYYAKLVRIVDGDTAILDIDLGFHIHTDLSIRFEGYNAPELHGPNRELALKASKELETLLTGKDLMIRTKAQFTRSFARYVAKVYVSDNNLWVDICELMKSRGYNSEPQTFLIQETSVDGGQTWKKPGLCKRCMRVLMVDPAIENAYCTDCNLYQTMSIT